MFIESFVLDDKDLIIVPLMCILCVAIPFVLVTIAPRFIPAAEVNLFFLLEQKKAILWKQELNITLEWLNQRVIEKFKDC